MAHYSDFGLRVHGSRHDLLSKLVTRIVGVQQGDENHAIALDFALQHAYYHSHGDPNPSHVAEFYDGVERRLRDDSQTAKAAALRALRHRALLIPRPPDGSPDHPWPLLALLAALAGQPLESGFKETPELLALLYQQQQPAGAAAAGGAGGRVGAGVSPARRLQPHARRAAHVRGGVGTSSGDEEEGSDEDVDPYGCPSDLSDWGDDAGGSAGIPSDDAEAESDTAPLGGQGLTDAHAAVAAAAGGRWVGPAASPVTPARDLAAPLAAPRPGDLLSMLTALRLGSAPWLAPDPAHCHPQRALAAAALAALQGDAAEGFLLDPSSGALTVDPRVTTPGLSPGALRAALQDFAEAGTAARALLHISRRLAGGDAAGAAAAGGAAAAAPFGFPVTPCLRAFGAALADQLATQGAEIASLQSALRAGPDQNADAPGALAAARRAAGGAIERLHLLRSLVEGVLQEVGGTPPQASAALIDCLYRRLACGDPAPSGAAGDGAAAAVLHLLVSSLMPLMGALGRWLYGGREGGCSEASTGGDGTSSGTATAGALDNDFFVLPVETLPVQDPKFWSQAFALASGGAGADGAAADGTGVACPSFLAPLAADILSAGKSLRLLRYMQQEELAAAPLQMRILGDGTSGGGAAAAALAGKGEELAWHRGPAPAVDAREDALAGAAAGPRRRWGGRLSSRGGAAVQHTAPTTSTGGSAVSSGLVRMSAAARLQLAVAAAAAQHGEDGAAFQLRFAEDASDLLRRWEAALPAPLSAGAAAAAAAEAAVVAPALHGSPAPVGADKLLLLLPPGSGGCDAGGDGAAWLPCPIGAGPDQGRRQQEQHHHQQRQQQEDMFTALEEAGRSLQCPGTLLRGGSSSGGGRSAAALLLGDSSDASWQGRQHAEESGSTAPAPALHQAAANNRWPEAAAAVAAIMAAGDGETAAEAGTAGIGSSADGVPPLSAWSAALRGDLAAADARLQRLVPRTEQAAVRGGSGPRAGKGATAPALALSTVAAGGCSGGDRWGSEDGGSEGGDGEWEGDDDTRPGSDVANTAAGAACSVGPDERPSELWPLRRRRGVAAASAAAAWLSSPLRPQRRLAWLLSRPPRMVGPVQMLLERTLLEPVKERVESIGSQLLGCLLGEWGLQSELRALAGTYLLASPAVSDWADGLLAQIESLGGLEALDTGELTMGLRALAAAAPEDDPLPPPSSLVVSVDTAALDAARAARPAGGPAAPQGAAIAELSALRVWHLGSWLLSLVAEPAQLARYNQALVFLLQLRWSRREVDAARLLAAKCRLCSAGMAALDASERDTAEAAAAARARQLATHAAGDSGTAGGAAGSSMAAAGAAAVGAAGRWLSVAQEHLLLAEMGHLLGAVHGYVMDRLMAGAWRQLEEALASAASLDGVRSAHAAFQEAALTQCCAGAGRGRGATWRHIGIGLLQLLEAALRAARTHRRLQALRAQRAESEAAAEAAAMGRGSFGGRSGGSAAARGPMLAAAAATAALEVAALRGELSSASAAWRGGRGYLLRILSSRALQLGGDEGVDALLGMLSFNSYYSE